MASASKETFSDRLSESQRRWVGAGLLCLAGVLLFAAMVYFRPDAIDWNPIYAPAARLLLQGRSPYEIEYFFAPPWALIPLIPFTFFPSPIDRALNFVCSVAIFAYVCYRLGGKPAAVTAFLLSPMVTSSLLQGNIENWVLLGLALPPQIGLVFLTMKPQATAGVIVYLFVQAWRTDGPRGVVQAFWPVALVWLLSFLIFGLWPLRFEAISDLAGPFNISLWPAGLPIGVMLLLAAIRKQELRYSMMASPFFAPYAVLMSWSTALAGFSDSNLDMIVAVIASWVFWAIYRLYYV